MKLKDLKPVKYQIRNDIFIELAYGRDNIERWKIMLGGISCLSKKYKEFEVEPQPSSRTDEYLKDHRFDSAEEALEFWEGK